MTTKMCARRSRGSSAVWATTCDVFASAEAFEVGTVTADCLIVDAGLPGVSGPELCERLRRKGNPTPVVLVTGGTDTKARDACRAMDIATVVKPFDDITLLAAIAAAVDRERHAG